MLIARFVPILFVARRRRRRSRGKRVAPAGLGTMRTDTPTFVVLLIGVVVLVGALTFFPALLLGPDRPGPDRPPVLSMRRDLITSALAVVVFTVCSGSSTRSS